MYKLVTNDSSAYPLSMLPFEALLEKKGMQVKVMCIPFGAEIDTLAAVKEICTDELKTSVLEVYEDSVLVRELKDYTVLEQITTAKVTDVDGNDLDILMAKLSQSTTIVDQIRNIETQIESLNAANEIFKKENESLKSNINTLTDSMNSVNSLSTMVKNTSDEVTMIKEKIADVDENSLDLESLKTYRINKSKVNLATYLENNTVSSTAHGGVSAEYSMTSEKQNQLMAVIMMTTLNPDYNPSWNASGEVCTSDWKLEELLALTADIEAVVRPLVAKQQTMEVAIRKASTIADVKAVDISFE